MRLFWGRHCIVAAGVVGVSGILEHTILSWGDQALEEPQALR